MSEAEAVQEEVADENSIEEIARSGGWSPEEEWRGDSDKWKDAPTFVKEGIKIQGKQHEKIERLQTSVDKVTDNIKKMAEGEAQRTRKALEGQKTRLEQQRQEAFDDQDHEKFNQVEQEIAATNSQLETEAPIVDQAFVDGEKDFIEKNEWYGKKGAMTASALSIAQNLRTAMPDLSADEYYTEIETAIKAQYPNEFRNENRDKGSSVSGDKPGGSRSKSKSFSSLSDEAKASYEEIKLFTPMTEAEYAKAFYQDNE